MFLATFHSMITAACFSPAQLWMHRQFAEPYRIGGDCLRSLTKLHDRKTKHGLNVFKVLLLCLRRFFCPSWDTLIVSNFLLHSQCGTALKQIRIFTLTKELNPNIAEAISYHSEAGFTDHIENGNSS